MDVCACVCMCACVRTILRACESVCVRVRAHVYSVRVLVASDAYPYVQVTSDPLVGRGRMNLTEIVDAAKNGWKTLSIDLEAPKQATTLQDEENKNNPYWLSIPRSAHFDVIARLDGVSILEARLYILYMP